jgi:hypothetical protein
VEEIQGAVRTAIQQCCVQLKSKITRAQAAREQRQRKKNLTKYIPNVAAALFTVLQAVAARPAEGQAAGTCRACCHASLLPAWLSETGHFLPTFPGLYCSPLRGF